MPNAKDWLAKVPEVTLMFWVIKILATTVGETGGDAFSMTLNLGYAYSSLVLLGFFAITLAVQIKSQRYHPAIYWSVVVATTTVGTTISDMLDRSLGLGYVKSSALLFCAVLLVLFSWHRATGRVEFKNIRTRTDEAFYWLTILLSNTLGTALGDFTATDTGLGFEWGAILFSGLIALVAAAHFGLRTLQPSVLFWSAYILTRPLGATLGDLLTKPQDEGGLQLGRIISSLAIIVVMMVMIVLNSAKRFRLQT